MDLRQHVRYDLRLCLFCLTRSRPICTFLQNVPDLMSLILHFAESKAILLLCYRLILELRPALADCLEVAQEQLSAEAGSGFQTIKHLRIIPDLLLNEPGGKSLIVFRHFKFRTEF